MRDAVIVDVVRSPMGKGKAPKDGKPGGVLSGVHAVELLSQTVKALLDRNPALNPAEVDDFIVGCVSQVSEQAGCIGRWAWLGADLPEHVPSTVVDRRCGSAQQAFDFGAAGIMAGVYDVVVTGGIESMSRIPMGTARLGADVYGPSSTARYAPGLVPQGISAELVAARWNIDREALDAYSARSHQRAAAAAAAGGFDNEIVPITTPDGVVSVDESIRPATTAEGLAGLKPAFQNDEMAARFPQINWSITAGNSSQITDGAAALLIMSAERADALGLRPRARFHAFAVASDDPITMLSGPIPATEKALKRSGLSIDQLDHYEVNEAFASVPLAWASHFDADPAKLNPRGGAIALGHPLGASGARIMATMLNHLEATGGRYGLQTMCEAGGMANATIIERL